MFGITDRQPYIYANTHRCFCEINSFPKNTDDAVKTLNTVRTPYVDEAV